MKKTKLLIPILSAGVIAATIAPMVTMTACNKKDSKKDNIKIININTPDYIYFDITYACNKTFDTEKYDYMFDSIALDTQWTASFDISEFNTDTKQGVAHLQHLSETPLDRDTKVNVWLRFVAWPHEGQGSEIKILENQILTINVPKQPVFSSGFAFNSTTQSTNWEGAAKFGLKWTKYEDEPLEQFGFSSSQGEQGLHVSAAKIGGRKITNQDELNEILKSSHIDLPSADNLNQGLYGEFPVIPNLQVGQLIKNGDYVKFTIYVMYKTTASDVKYTSFDLQINLVPA